MCCILLFFPVLTEGFRRIQWQFSLIRGRDDMRFASRFGIGYSLLQFIEMLQIIGLPAIQCFYRKFGEVDANREPVFTLRLGQPGEDIFSNSPMPMTRSPYLPRSRTSLNSLPSTSCCQRVSSDWQSCHCCSVNWLSSSS